MQLVSSSAVCRFFLWLWQAALTAYESSLLARIFRAVADWWKRWWHGSALVRFFFEKDGAIYHSWRDSRFCHLLSFVLNIPASLLHMLYKKFQPVFDSSFIARLFFAMGDHVPEIVGWFMLIAMNIRYGWWNNGYALAGYIIFFVLTIIGGMRRRNLRFDLASIGPYIIVFFCMVLLACPLSRYPEESVRYLYYHFAAALCVLVIVSTVQTGEQLERLAGFGCLGMAGTAGYAFSQRIQGVAVSSSYVDLSVNINMPGRVTSYYSNSNAYAELLVMLIPVGFALMFGAKRRFYQIFGGISALMGCVAILMTYSRASWLGLVAAAIVFVYLWNRKLLPICIALGLMALPLLPSSILNRLLTLLDPSKDSSISSRITLYEAGGRMIAERPLTGAGLGTSVVKQSMRDLHLYFGSSPFVHAHNTYLQIWLETGVMGAVTFVASMYHALKRGAKAVLSSKCSRPVGMVTLGAVSGIAGSLVCGMADYLWNYPRVMLIFWFTMALLLTGVKLANQEAHGHHHAAPSQPKRGKREL